MNFDLVPCSSTQKPMKELIAFLKLPYIATPTRPGSSQKVKRELKKLGEYYRLRVKSIIYLPQDK